MKYLVALSRFIVTVAVVIFIFAHSAVAGQWSIQGVYYDVDTITPTYMVGPGTYYTKYRAHDFPLDVYVMEVDLTNPYIHVETGKAGPYAYSVETLPGIVERGVSEGRNIIGAINSDLSSESNSPAPSGIFRNNEMITNPISSSACFVMDEFGNPHIDQVDFDGVLNFAGELLPINSVNYARFVEDDSNSDNICLYTNAYGPETNAGTQGKRVVISPKTQTFKWFANTDINCVIDRVLEGTGSAEIPQGKAVLWARGKYASLFTDASVGSDIEITLKVNLRDNPGKLKNFKEMAGAWDQHFMHNGQYAVAWDERHPRSCIGFSADSTRVYYLVVDGRSTASAGVTLAEAYDIFKTFGVYNCLNLDGGGSTTMTINSTVVNNPSGGALRPVSNAWLAVSTAPEDSEIASIVFEPKSYRIPAGAVVPLPAIYGYSKYGSLLDKSLGGVKYSCDVQVGRVAGLNLELSTEPAVGYIYAEFNGIKTKQLVEVVHTQIEVASERIVVDNKAHAIKLLSSIGDNVFSINAGNVDWDVEDEDVVSVENGSVRGLKIGSTRIFGFAQGFEDTITVAVEIPQKASMPLQTPFEAGRWVLKQSGGSGIEMSQFNEGFKLAYTGTGVTRGAYISAQSDIDTYGLPMGFVMEINPGEAVVNNISMSVTNNLGERGSVVFSELPLNKNETSVLVSPLNNLWDVSDNSIYPISIKTLRFEMGGSSKGKLFEIQIPRLDQYYGDMSGVDIVLHEDASDAFRLYPNPVSSGAVVVVEGNHKDALVEVYDVGGGKVKSVEILSQGEICTSDMLPGLYIVKKTSKSGVSTAKLIVKR